MSSPPRSTRGFDFILRELFTAALGVLGIYVSTRIMKRVLDPNAEARERMRGRRDAVLARLREAGVASESLSGLSSAEEALLYDIVFPEDISASFSSIGGLGGVKEAVKEIIVYPMLYPDVFRAPAGGRASGGARALLAPPKGVLLYGPPGTGKTLLAKALAKESGAVFLALSPSSLLSKWLGETEQIARAVFSLARRVAPTIVFIDEVDGLFRERHAGEHEAHKNLKAEFMQLWDGLATDDADGSQVVVLGATNRPYDVDPAILRRMPRAFEVGLPTRPERAAILRTLLAGVRLERAFSFDGVAAVTGGYSGSDLKELCRAAMMQPVREAMRRARAAAAERAAGGEQKELRPLTLDDVLAARRDVTRTEDQSADYHARQQRFAPGTEQAYAPAQEGPSAAAMAPLMQLLAQMSDPPRQT